MRIPVDVVGSLNAIAPTAICHLSDSVEELYQRGTPPSAPRSSRRACWGVIREWNTEEHSPYSE
jgi:hypothetical protein